MVSEGLNRLKVSTSIELRSNLPPVVNWNFLKNVKSSNAYPAAIEAEAMYESVGRVVSVSSIS